MIKTKLEKFVPVIEAELSDALAHSTNEFNSVYKAMEYSLLSGGKRLRPFILNEFFVANGGEENGANNFGAALEMIHTYSLIHDDLPAMDNDDFRRGKPSCHKAFGEDIAILAGDGLLTLAFETASECKSIPEERVVKAVSVLAKCAGNNGMIGGQVIDIESEKTKISINRILEMYAKKTSALLIAAGVIGTVLAGGSEEKINAAKEYALNLGIAFQIQDDILDLTGNSAVLGKPVGSDAENEKSTYLSVTGLEKAKEDVLMYTEKSIDALKVLGNKGETLKELALYLINRNK